MRKAARVAGVALTAALLGSGCGSVEPESEESSAPPTAAGLRSGEADGSELDGSWLAGSGQEQYLLSILDGEGASLIGAVYCTGTVEQQDTYVIHLDCPEGDDDRTAGTLTLLPEGTSLAVRWNGAGQEVFHRVEKPEDLPDDFPTAIGDPAETNARAASTAP